jgi:hypothetical protein
MRPELDWRRMSSHTPGLGFPKGSGADAPRGESVRVSGSRFPKGEAVVAWRRERLLVSGFAERISLGIIRILHRAGSASETPMR